MEARGGKLSPKSAVLASDANLREEVAAAIREQGQPIQSKEHTRDLGMDATRGTKVT